MAYKSYYASNDTETAAKPKAGGYQSYFGNTVRQAPSSQELEQQKADQVKQQQQAKAAQPKPAEQKKGTNLFGKAKKLVKDLAVASTVGEQKFAQGIARTLPGGTADLDAQKKSADVDSQNLQRYTDLHKAGKINDIQYKKLTGASAAQSSTTQKTTTDITKKMPTKTQIGLGAASTAADILTAGTLPKLKATLFGARAAKAARFGDAAAQLGGNAAAGALNAAAGGGNGTEIAQNAAAGALLPEVLSRGGSLLAKGVRKAADSAPVRDTKAVFGKDKATNDLITNQRINSIPKAELDKAIAANPGLVETPGIPQPGEVIKPQSGPLRAEPRVEGDAASKPIVATPAHKQAVDDYIAKAHTENPVFQQGMGNLSKDLGLKYIAGPVKGADRALTKVVEKYGGNPARLKDTVRGTIEVPDHSTGGFNKVIDKIKEKYDVVEIKDDYKNYKNGYVDMKVIVKTPGGHNAEIILATPEMLQAKNKLGGHELYEISRDSTKTPQERKAAAEQMNILYDNAHDSANKRLASVSESPSKVVNTSKAPASDTGRADSSKAPTSLDEPVKTTSSRNNPSGSSRTDKITSSDVLKNDTGERSVIPSTIAKNEGDVKAPEAKRTLTPSETSHMEAIGGYTHSKDMENEYADMLRQTESGLTGGQMIKNADGTYRRISEHSKFYREFYAENGKAPTKADWLDEAKRQLASGNDQFGAHDDYKALLEREAKGIPGIHVDAEIPAKIDRGAPAKGNKASRVYDRLKDEYPEELSEKVDYTTINLKEQADRAVALIEKDPQQAYRLAMGAETSTEVTNTAVNIAMAEKALDEGNAALFARLTKNRSLTQTRRGQEIVSEKGSVLNNSTSKYVKELIASRLDKVGKKYLTSAGLVLKKDKGAAVREKAIKAIDQEVKKAGKAIRGRKIDIKAAQDILDSITCK